MNRNHYTRKDVAVFNSHLTEDKNVPERRTSELKTKKKKRLSVYKYPLTPTVQYILLKWTMRFLLIESSRDIDFCFVLFVLYIFFFLHLSALTWCC